MIKLEDYIFNIEKLFSLTNDVDKQFIQGLYNELLAEIRSIPNINSTNYTFVFNTLYYGGFLINKVQFDREKVFEALDV